jgi:DNA helicase-2/ATP-dependent DNA helicase PcrA
MEEERRLAYVGITRAKDELFLTFAARRTIYGNTQISQVSRFVREVPKELLKQQSNRGRGNTAIGSGSRAGGRWSRDEYSQVNPWEEAQAASRIARQAVTPAAPPKPKGAPGAGFKIGEKVKHAVFGTGTVLGTIGEGDDAQITVAFPNIGVKKLVAGFARLEKV